MNQKVSSESRFE